MTPDPSAWRSSADYEHIKELTASDLAWNGFCRNETYNRDFQAFRDSPEDRQSRIEQIGQVWRLRFPRRSSRSPTQSSRALAAAGRYERYCSG